MSKYYYDGVKFDEPPRQTSKGLIGLFEQYMRSASQQFDTGMPVTVLSVDYNRCLVTVQPNIRTWLEFKDTQIQQLPVEEVPILFEDADNGDARVTVPIQEGDTGVLVYASRHTSTFLESDGKTIQDTDAFEGAGFNGATPKLGFRAGMKTKSEARPFEKDKIVVEYGKAKSTISKQGEIKSTNGSISSVLSPDGSGEISNTSGGSFKLNPDGTFNINGVIIGIDGSITSPSAISAASSLKVADVEMKGHPHSAGTYKVGQSPVTGESGEPIG